MADRVTYTTQYSPSPHPAHAFLLRRESSSRGRLREAVRITVSSSCNCSSTSCNSSYKQRGRGSCHVIVALLFGYVIPTGGVAWSLKLHPTGVGSCLLLNGPTVSCMMSAIRQFLVSRSSWYRFTSCERWAKEGRERMLESTILVELQSHV